MTPMLRWLCLLAGAATVSGIAAAQDLQLRGHPDRSEVVIGEPFLIEDLAQRDTTRIEEYTDVFPDTIPRLYCVHGVVRFPGARRVLRHVWRWQGKQVAEIPIVLTQTTLRAWSFVEFPNNPKGAWVVEIYDQTGRLLKQAHFRLTDDPKEIERARGIELAPIVFKVKPVS